MDQPHFIPDTPIAFFDLDKTITDMDTDYLWARWQSKKNIKGFIELIRLYYLMYNYRKGSLDIEKYMRFHKYRFGSKKLEKIQCMAITFFNEIGINHIRKGILEIIKVFKDKKTKLVLITAQNKLIAEPFSNYFGFDGVFGNELEYIDSALKDPIKPYCFQDGKIYWADLFSKSIGVNLKDCAFYTDSINDLPLMKKVKYPVAISPDDLLASEAMKNNWQIINL